MVNYTKGEWKVVKTHDAVLVCSGQKQIAYMLGAKNKQEANVQLIASAPDLYEALRAIYDDVGGNLTIMPSVRYKKMVKALAKAENKND